jgi:hypothetical protein
MKTKINKTFEIGDKVLIKDGRGNGGEGWIYGYKKFGSDYLYKVFSIDYIYSLNNDNSKLYFLQGNYEDKLLEKVECRRRELIHLEMMGLDKNRKTFNLTTNKNYPLNDLLYMSYE